MPHLLHSDWWGFGDCDKHVGHDERVKHVGHVGRVRHVGRVGHAVLKIKYKSGRARRVRHVGRERR